MDSPSEPVTNVEEHAPQRFNDNTNETDCECTPSPPLPLPLPNAAGGSEGSSPPVLDLTPFVKCNAKPFAFSPCSELFKGVHRGECIVARRVRFQDDKVVGEAKVEEAVKRLMQGRNVNILGYLGTCVFDSDLCIVTHFAEGGHLSRHIAAHSGCDRKKLLFQVEKGLEYLHKVGIVHGNLHPRNVLLKDGVVKLSEFGLFEVIPDEGFTSMRPESAREKALHRAPELNQGEPMAPSCDVYSFGMLVFHAYCDKEPMIERYPGAAPVVAALSSGQRPERSEITRSDFSDELWETLRRCWAHDKLDRPTMIGGDIVLT